MTTATTPDSFKALIKQITDHIKDAPLNAELGAMLNRSFPADGQVFKQLFAACREGIAAGWLCAREAGGIKFGRAIKPDAALNGYSVDVVDMTDIKGPHHRHPNGEIDLIMPITPNAQFDGHGAGWLVYPPDSAHFPTVSQGQALVLYLLPQGAIEFTR